MSTNPKMERSSAVLTERFVAVEQAAVQAGERIPADVAANLHTHLDAVRDRLSVGVDYTVVALVGGTGSGKSSLFNVLTGINFAEVGVKRPTTSEPLACVWGESADRLLDHLGIATENRYKRESELDAGTEDDLRGLVLVDVPDHDSVAEHHREYVDQIVPLADVLVWVLDPQKYADAAVHTQYLQQLGGHERSLMAVLNKIDTVPEVAVPSLLTDIKRLLTADGLDDVPVRAVSTETEEGIPALREVLSQLTQTRSAAAVRAAVDLRAAGDLLAPTVAEAEPKREDLPVSSAAATLSEAGDVLALQARMRDALLDVKTREALPKVSDEHSIDDELVESAREKIITPARARLPELWAQSVSAAVPLGAELKTELRSAFQNVPLPEPPTGLRRARQIFSWLFLLLTLAFVGWGIWLAAAPNSAPTAPNWNVPFLTDAFAGAGYERLTVPLLGAAIMIVLWLVVLAIFGSQLRRARDQRSAEYGAGLRAASAALVGERIVGPITTVHHSHREVREVITRVRAELAGKRPSEVVRDAVDKGAGAVDRDAAVDGAEAQTAQVQTPQPQTRAD